MKSNRKSLKAYLNILWILIQRRLGFEKIYGYPFLLTIDPTSICQLRCPFCPTGLRNGYRSNAVMPLELYKHIIDELGPYVFRIDLFNFGEPLLNKYFVDMVKYAGKYNIRTCVSTNLSIKLEDQQIEELLLSGLDRVVISLDGVTEEKYLKYRRGGNFDLVFSNMLALVKKKKKLGIHKPDIIWQMLVFRHNEEDLETAKQIAAEIGVELLLSPPYVPQDNFWREMTPTMEKFNLYSSKNQNGNKKILVPEVAGNKPRTCDWLYGSAVINANGSVSPCCTIWKEEDDFGNLEKCKFKDVYNNKKYRAARRYFKNGRRENPDIICSRCTVEGQQMMFEPFLKQITGSIGGHTNPTVRRLVCRMLKFLY